MPRATNMAASTQLIKALVNGVEKAGKSTWAAEAAEAGFNVLYLDGDVAAATIGQLSPGAQARIFYMDVSDDLVGTLDANMIQIVADLFSSTNYVWNDSQRKRYSIKGYEPTDEVWEIRPALFDHRWVIVIDSWTTLSYSALLAKAQDLGEDIANVERIGREVYSGTGNRLTNILTVIQKAPCHVIVIGHPDEYQKKKAPDKTRVGAMKETDMEIEWTRMVAKSCSRPHSLTMGKFFTDVGWLDITRTGKRELSFKLDPTRSSGGHLDSKGDPRETHSFANLVRAIGGTVPDATRPEDILPALTIHDAGEYQPASKATSAVSPSGAPSKVTGIGGLMGMRK